MIVGNKLLLIAIAIALPLVTLLVIGTQTYENIITFQHQTKFIEETHQLILSLQNLLTLIINAETGQRGFIITGNETYLEPYERSLSNLNSIIVKIEKLNNDKHSDLLQNAKLSIYPLLKHKITELNKTIDIMRTLGFNASAAMISTDEGKRIMDQIRNGISAIINEEEKMLQNNTKQSVIDGQNLLFKYIVGIVVSITITTVAIIFTYSQLNIKHRNITNLLKIEINKKTKALQESNLFLKKLNNDLKKQDIMQKEFINIAAHELRTPVQSIIGYIAMVKSFPENFKNYLEPLERNSVRLYQLTEDILDVAKIESNNLNLKKEKFDISLLLKGSIDEFANKIRNEKNNEFKLIRMDGDYEKYSTKDKEELFVLGDKNRIQQVISNLLSNAYKFTENGKIIVKIKQDNNNNNNNVKISVQDDGEGIDERIKQTLFQKFMTKSGTGTGLGLYISKNIIEAHGGTIIGYNNNLYGKKGSTFEFTLPGINHHNKKNHDKKGDE